MAKRKIIQTDEPIVIRGSHSIRTEYPDGRVEFETIWEELVNDVNQALREYSESKLKPAVKAKTTRKKKVSDKDTV